MQTVSQGSYYKRIFGRSLITIVFGNFFEKKNNTAAILAIILVLTLCWIIITREKYEFLTGLINIVFVIIGYYFGAKQSTVVEEKETD